ncbi:MAG: hypothetical protein JNL74_15170 [Fibrobacteres bacterium]|nr:hypothetical protein [Fibrobacterota bacterium]
MDQEEKRIKKMVSEGVITKAEAAKLLDAMHRRSVSADNSRNSSRLKTLFSVIELICVLFVTAAFFYTWNKNSNSTVVNSSRDINEVNEYIDSKINELEQMGFDSGTVEIRITIAPSGEILWHKVESKDIALKAKLEKEIKEWRFSKCDGCTPLSLTSRFDY